jgi:hypothetical protein
MDLLDLLRHLLLLEAVRCPREFIETIIEEISDICARFPPRFGRLGREVGIEVG